MVHYTALQYIENVNIGIISGRQENMTIRGMTINDRYLYGVFFIEMSDQFS